MHLSPPKPKRLPKPADGLIVVLGGKTPEREKIPGRVYVTSEGVEVPWLDDRNPAVWRGQQDED